MTMMESLMRRLRQRHCKRINRYCVTHDVAEWESRDIRERCPTFADRKEKVA